MKRILMICAAASLLLTAAGCRSDREGDPPREEKRNSRKAPAKKSRRRDPADDMFLGVGKGAKAESFANDNLSRREQSLLSEEMRRQDDEMRDMRKLHREMDSGRSKRKEWVYGFKPLGSK